VSRNLGVFFGEGLSLQAKQRSAPPPKTTGLPLAGPDQARSLRLSPSRSTACRRDPRRRRTQHPSCYLRQAPRRRQTHWRVTSNWPPSPCPLHGAPSNRGSLCDRPFWHFIAAQQQRVRSQKRPNRTALTTAGALGKLEIKFVNRRYRPIRLCPLDAVERPRVLWG
jgi:hypothetical protein